MDENMKLDVRQNYWRSIGLYVRKLYTAFTARRGETAMQHFWQSLESGFKDLK
ncbi:hypothetical protein T4E_4703 [Trichinella pseudospiralis]|uniref:Uncharacterized protein n=1 Tax=Trichinella pseudospiralis TaxID=6337 RepID=A0A0V0XMK4_TRIPS|nr:hypothetical protein T4E_4703 [Trichinella pseudospiralis]